MSKSAYQVETELMQFIRDSNLSNADCAHVLQQLSEIHAKLYSFAYNVGYEHGRTNAMSHTHYSGF